MQTRELNATKYSRHLLTAPLPQPSRQQSNCKSGRNFFNFFFAIA